MIEIVDCRLAGTRKIDNLNIANRQSPIVNRQSPIANLKIGSHQSAIGNRDGH